MSERTKWDKSTGLAEGVDWTDRESGEPAPLTEEQKAELLTRLRNARHTPKQHFGEAATWVLYVFGWMILKDDQDVPWNYGARFVDFANYIMRRRTEREQEEIVEDSAYA